MSIDSKKGRALTRALPFFIFNRREKSKTYYERQDKLCRLNLKGEYIMKTLFKWVGKTILSLGMLCAILYVFMTYVTGLIL